jgi:octopine/nopaline transport system permease protein|tara:strand:- start:27 stop:716 length:690 start_codon:yes stop_codon:yes gene_type:complete
MNYELMIETFPKLLDGLSITLQLVTISLFLGFCFAIGMALLRLSNNLFLNFFAKTYIFYFRGTPLLVQIFLIYYGIAQFEFIRESFLWSFFKDAYWCGILALTLNTCAYGAEIIRGGIQSVSFGQIESARSVGMSKFLLYRRIILPIAFRQALPAYGNEMILMVKATSLVSTITIMDVTGIARLVIAKTFSPVEIFIMAGLIYLTINFIITRLVSFTETKLTPYLQHAK